MQFSCPESLSVSWCDVSVSSAQSAPPLCSVCTVSMSVFDQCCSHSIPLCQKCWKWCSACSLVFRLIRLCVFKKRQTQHHRNPTCPWQNAVNPWWHQASQKLHTNTNTSTHTNAHSWHHMHLANSPLSHLVLWHFHWAQLSLLRLLGLISPVISKTPSLCVNLFISYFIPH